MLVPLYSDLFSFSLIARTDDWGATWQVSPPIVGAGNVQPTIAQRNDGVLVAFFRDNGPPPKRVMQANRATMGRRGRRRVTLHCPIPARDWRSSFSRAADGYW